jgi:hypothetical protein
VERFRGCLWVSARLQFNRNGEFVAFLESLVRKKLDDLKRQSSCGQV